MIDTTYTSEPICPNCGHDVSDAWELSDDAEVECGWGCGAEFVVIRHISINYSTQIIRVTPVDAP